MGDALLLQRGVFMGVVLRLSLCPTDIRYVLISEFYLALPFLCNKRLRGGGQDGVPL